MGALAKEHTRSSSVRIVIERGTLPDQDVSMSDLDVYSDLDGDADDVSGPAQSSGVDSPRPSKRRRLFRKSELSAAKSAPARDNAIDINDEENAISDDFLDDDLDGLSSPKPNPPPQKPAPQPDDDGFDDLDDDPDLRAAIEASLESFEIENAANQGSQSLPKQTVSTSTGAAPDTAIDLDDLPSDAFDSSPSLSPVENPTRSVGTTRASTSFGQSRRTNLRQTTLFSYAPQNTSSNSRDWSPPPRDEPPTHHKLDPEAMKTWVYPMNLGAIRDYQFNIVQKGLFHNLLVALPTGLGKTFIAATIMLNWFRWTKTAQIVFVAPTKPLVSQQVEACFGVAGIPRSKTTLLTGNVPPGTRAQEWERKRVFFMTPQTLINDLRSGIADPKRIVLLVVDEAHRATGGYAYVEVVKFLRRFNNSFRILALTATPGSTVEAVQAVIDGLDIARVEIRTEQSLDIRQYVHARNIDIQTFTDSEEMTLCMDLLSKALQHSVDELRNLNAFWSRDPMALTPYGLTKARQQWMASPAGRNANFGLRGKVNALFNVLASLAHGIELLKYHGIIPFYRHIASFKSDSEQGQKGGKTQRAIVQNENFKRLISHLEPWSKNPEFIGHPKLGYLRELILNHFLDAGESNTKVMIFAHFRDSAEEIVRVLKRHDPIVRPHVFVGQASAKGSEGMDQKKQLDVVEKFKKGTYNVIVATSIGEEGLDIGEVDLIVCYDSSSSPIRMLQRMGRTGRKRAGNIVLLLMQGKEEESYIKAKDNYEKMQQMIASGSRFTFHEDRSPRILPRDVRPDVDKRVIDIPPENSQADLPEPTKRSGKPPKRPPKKFHMPDGVETGFTKVSTLQFGKQQAKTRPRTPTPTPPPEPVEIPSIDEVALTPRQELELEERYCNVVGGDSPQYIRAPRNDAFPDAQRTFRPTKHVGHGSVTRRFVRVLRKMHNMDAECEDRYNKILDDIRERAPEILAARAGKEAARTPKTSSREGSDSPSTDGKEPAKTENPITVDSDSDSLLDLEAFFKLPTDPTPSKPKRKRDVDDDSDLDFL